jgi:hypothetical protein
LVKLVQLVPLGFKGLIRDNSGDGGDDDDNGDCERITGDYLLQAGEGPIQSI